MEPGWWWNRILPNNSTTFIIGYYSNRYHCCTDKASLFVCRFTTGLLVDSLYALSIFDAIAGVDCSSLSNFEAQMLPFNLKDDAHANNNSSVSFLLFLLLHNMQLHKTIQHATVKQQYTQGKNYKLKCITCTSKVQ